MYLPGQEWSYSICHQEVEKVCVGYVSDKEPGALKDDCSDGH